MGSGKHLRSVSAVKLLSEDNSLIIRHLFFPRTVLACMKFNP